MFLEVTELMEEQFSPFGWILKSSSSKESMT